MKYRYLVDRETGDIRLRSSGSLEPRDPDSEVLLTSDEKLLPGFHVYDFKEGCFAKVPEATLARRKTEKQKLTVDMSNVQVRFMSVFRILTPELREVVLLLMEYPDYDLLPTAKEVDSELRRKEGRKKKAGTKVPAASSER